MKKQNPDLDDLTNMFLNKNSKSVDKVRKEQTKGIIKEEKQLKSFLKDFKKKSR